MLGRPTAFTDRLCIRSISLAATNIRFDVGRRDQPHLVPGRSDQASPGDALLRMPPCPPGTTEDPRRRLQPARAEVRRMTTRPPASTPWTWNTRFARSRPTVVTCVADGSSLAGVIQPTTTSGTRCHSAGAVHPINFILALVWCFWQHTVICSPMGTPPSSLTGITDGVPIRRSAGRRPTRRISARSRRLRQRQRNAMREQACEFVDNRLRQCPPDRAGTVPYGQAGENALRFPHLAHRSAPSFTRAAEHQGSNLIPGR